MIIYPMQNPNNAAFVLAILVITNQLLYQNVKKYKCLLIIISLVFLLGIILAYARTVLVSFLIAEFIVLSNSMKKKYLVIILTLVITGLIYVCNSFDITRYLTYYNTVFNAFEDNSFTERFKFWHQYWLLIQNYPFVIISGYPIYKELFKINYNSTVVDSSYLHFLLNYGILSIFYILIWFIKKIVINPKTTIPLIIFLMITSITLPFVSDVRMVTLIGVIFGVLQSKNSNN
ncbi:MAG: hypothetical protein GX638_14640 [Crenarchaeota archaeon]|nr:hypothetical protein [Thermoproteota archaeon]